MVSIASQRASLLPRGLHLVLRSTLLSLRDWASVPGRQFALVIRDEPARTVRFDHAAGAIVADPVVEFSDPAPSDFYRLVLRFIEV